MKVIKSISKENAPTKACVCTCAQHVGAAMQHPTHKTK
jgi:hypothetical protein